MYCDETAKATNILFGRNIPLDNRNRSATRRKKNSSFWPPAAIPTFENVLTVEAFEISTPDWRRFAQD
jgi:hypothetical protein